MFNLKWGLLAAAAGFVLAFASSLVFGHTTFIIALLRALLFGAIFFGLGNGVWMLINTYIPELLFSDSQGSDAEINPFASAEAAGTRVNISVDDSGAALPDSMQGSGASGEVGDFNDLVSGAIRTQSRDIDQTPSAGYTGIGDSGFDSQDSVVGEGDFSPMFNDVKTDTSLGDFTMDFGAFVAGDTPGKAAVLDPQEDSFASSGSSSSDSLMDSFSLFPSATDAGMFEEPAPRERKPAGNKNQKLDGDFNAKDIAAGLRTVLEKDKKG